MPGISLEWTKNDDSLFYASYTEGFKSGGFNAVDDQNPDFAVNPTPPFTVPGAGFQYDDETAQSFEIGGKHTFLDGAMNFNWALFTSEYDNQQVSTFVGLGFVVANAASSKVDGLEMDLLWQANDNLRLGANLSFLDATYGSFPAAACNDLQTSVLRPATAAGLTASFDGCTTSVGADGNSSVTQDLAGKDLSGAPSYSGALFANYEREIGKGSTRWFFDIDINFTDSFSLVGDADPIDTQEGFEKINLRTGFRGENWSVTIYGDNITDEFTATGGFDIPLASGAHAKYIRPGEIYGARFSYNF
jgi:outer membrane receptor protein involved in Fe transport